LHVDCAGVRRLRTCGGWRLARPIRAHFLALYEITQASCATRVAPRTHRHPQTVMEWVHTYNERGAAALAYRRTGGRPPFARASQPNWMSSSAPPRARLPYPR
jgi:transposase